MNNEQATKNNNQEAACLGGGKPVARLLTAVRHGKERENLKA